VSVDATPPAVAEKATAPAELDCTEKVATPDAFVCAVVAFWSGATGVIVTPADGPAVSVTGTPCMRVFDALRTVTETVWGALVTAQGMSPDSTEVVADGTRFVLTWTPATVPTRSVSVPPVPVWRTFRKRARLEAATASVSPARTVEPAVPVPPGMMRMSPAETVPMRVGEAPEG